MFENLSEKLQRAFKTLRGQATLTEENIGEALREIRLALLEADVNFKVVKELIDHIQAKAVGQQVATALSPGEAVIKILRDELIETLGRDTARVKLGGAWKTRNCERILHFCAFGSRPDGGCYKPGERPARRRG